MSVTNIAGPSYLNGLAATTAYSRLSEWLSWTESFICVVRTPSQSDGYNRIFWTGESDGKLWCKGTFGSRAVYIPAPAKLPSIQGTDLYTPNGVTAVWAASGCASQTLTMVGITPTPTGYTALFNFSKQTDTGISSAPSPTITVTIPGINQGKTAPDGLRYVQTYQDDDGNSVTWAAIEYSSITPPSGTYTISGTSITWDDAQFTVAWDMHYEFSEELCDYLMTYVDDLGVEGPPSEVSAEFSRSPEMKVVLANIPVSDDQYVRKKRIYRSAAGTGYGAFFFLVELDNATTSYTDVRRDSELAETFTCYYNPPDGLLGLSALPNGMLVAGKNRDVWFCDQFIPTSWNPENVITVGWPIVNTAACGNEALILTTGGPSVISGDAPDGMSEARLMTDQSCVSALSVAKVGSSVLYAGPGGLVAVSGGQAQLITKQYFRRDDWQAWHPATIEAACHDNRYYGISDNTSFIIEMDGDGLVVTTHDMRTDALFNDIETDDLYLCLTPIERIAKAPDVISRWPLNEDGSDDYGLNDLPAAIPSAYFIYDSGLARDVLSYSSGDLALTCLHFDGSNGSTAPLADAASATRTWASSGGAALLVAQKKYGSACTNAIGQWTPSSTIAISGDFTLNFSLYRNTAGLPNWIWMLNSSGTNLFQIWTHPILGWSINFLNAAMSTSTSLFTASAWTDVELSRHGTTGYLFINGTLIASATVSAADYVLDQLIINYSGTNWYLDEFCIRSGCIHTASFTDYTEAFNISPATASYSIPLAGTLAAWTAADEGKWQSWTTNFRWKPTALSSSFLLYIGNNAVENAGYVIGFSGGNLAVWTATHSSGTITKQALAITAATAISMDAWQYITLTSTAVPHGYPMLKLYKDGVLIGSGTGIIMSYLYSIIYQGAGDSGYLSDASMFFNRTLTAAEILALSDSDGDPSLETFGTSSTPMQFEWRSKEFQAERPVNPSVFRVIAPSYSSTALKLYAENADATPTPLKVNDKNSRRIPLLRQERVWSFEVSSKAQIDSVEIATSMGDLTK